MAISIRTLRQKPARTLEQLAECHELYCAGHLIEAGVAFFQATGKRRLLDVVCRPADHIDSTFGPGENQLHGYPPPGIELALMRLYEVTEQPRYMMLASYFIGQRGTQPHFYDEEYENAAKPLTGIPTARRGWSKTKPTAAHLPISQQQTAIGHAVRFVYLMTGVAHLARLSNDEGKRRDCLRLWKIWRSVSCISPEASVHKAAAKPLAAITIYRMIRSMRKVALQSA